jgi:hypothetical protein
MPDPRTDLVPPLMDGPIHVYLVALWVVALVPGLRTLAFWCAPQRLGDVHCGRPVRWRMVGVSDERSCRLISPGSAAIVISSIERANIGIIGCNAFPSVLVRVVDCRDAGDRRA